MNYGLRHSYGEATYSVALHERKPIRETRHGYGYSVQSSVSSSSGGPEETLLGREPMTRYEDRDFRINEPGKRASKAAVDLSPEPFRQPAGYDLQGEGGQGVHDQVGERPATMGRIIRDETPLMSHPGESMRKTDYGHPGERGFRYRSRSEKV